MFCKKKGRLHEVKTQLGTKLEKNFRFLTTQIYKYALYVFLFKFFNLKNSISQ